MDVVSLLSARVKVTDALTTEYEDFGRYCEIAGKVYCDELTPVDFIAYRSQYGRSRDDIKALKNLLENAPCMSKESVKEDNSLKASAIDQEQRLPLDVALVEEGSFEDEVGNDKEQPISFETESVVHEPKDQSIPSPQDSKVTYAAKYGIDTAALATIKMGLELEKTFGITFSIRSSNALRGNNCKTLEDLFFYTPESLRNIRNLGAKSIKEIEEIIRNVAQQILDGTCFENNNTGIPAHSAPHVRPTAIRKAFADHLNSGFFDEEELTDAEVKYLYKMQKASEILGKDFAQQLLEDDEVVRYVVCLEEMLNDYSQSVLLSLKSQESAAESISRLPTEWKRIHLSHFVELFCLETELPTDNFAILFRNGEVRLEDYPTAVVRYTEELGNKGISLPDLKNDLSLLSKFEKWLVSIDVENLLQKLLSCTDSKDKKYWDVFQARAEGQTLEAIAQNMGGVTRERIRQIEEKVMRKIRQQWLISKHDLYAIISVLRDGDRILQREEVEETIGKAYADILWYCASKKELNTAFAHYDNENDLIVLRFGSDSTDMKQRIQAWIDSLPDWIETVELDHILESDAAQHQINPELCKLAVASQFKKVGIFSVKGGRVTVVKMCDYVLKYRFPNGYKIAEETDNNLFLQYLGELFGKTGYTTARAIDAKVMESGVLIDRGKYIHKDYVQVPNEIMEMISTYIEESPRLVLTYTEIFTALEDTLKGTMISNRYALQGAIKLYGCKYPSHRDYISKEGGGNVADELNAFVRAKKVVNKAEILDEFPGWKDYNLAMVLPRCPDIIGMDGGYFMHADSLNVSDEDKEGIGDYLNACIADIPVSSRFLYDEIMNRFPRFMIGNDIQTHGKLFGILQFLCGDTFFFSRPYVSKEKTGSVTNKSVLLQHMGDLQSIEISDFVDICEDNAIHFVSLSYLLSMMQPELLRINERTLMRREEIGLTEDIIQEIVDLINEAVSGHNGYLAANKVDDFSWYPSLSVPWTPFLLESVVSLLPIDIHIVSIQSSSMEIPHAIFVSDEYEEDDWNSLLVKLLRKESMIEPFQSKEDILRWLQSEGLCNVKLPAFLETENHIVCNEYGKLVVE